ncbi:unnamed protein product [Periconia digitata]|uniref:Uncharacterized protein n=1 Tax=Periconia digitata TaxID=1303443 RepID=A0A9W4U3E9_9PLEO|nr:unnamed protein product [Periconia digitata]
MTFQHPQTNQPNKEKKRESSNFPKLHDEIRLPTPRTHARMHACITNRTIEKYATHSRARVCARVINVNVYIYIFIPLMPALHCTIYSPIEPSFISISLVRFG